jgi:hypothetical protein
MHTLVVTLVVLLGESSAAVVDKQRWMANFQDARLKDLPIIPGTHHSSSRNVNTNAVKLVEHWVRNQYMSIPDQLNNGVRYLDFRIDADSRDIWISHNFIMSHRLRQSLESIKIFLNQNPTEVVLFVLRWDHQPKSDNLKQILQTNLANCLYEPVGPVTSTSLANLVIGQVAGKAVMLTDINAFKAENHSPVGPGDLRVAFSIDTSLCFSQLSDIEHDDFAKIEIQRYFREGCSKVGCSKLHGFVENYYPKQADFPLGPKVGRERVNNTYLECIETGDNRHPGIVALDFITEADSDQLFRKFQV